MDKKLFIANWKSHKTPAEVEAFFEALQASEKEIDWNNKKVIIAPTYPLLDKVLGKVKEYNLPISVSSQDVSSYDEGAYTGEVSAKLIKEYAYYAIIGHSERRELFHEGDELLKEKVNHSIGAGIAPIYCVQNDSQIVPDGVSIIAYEPPSSIGTGNPDDPEHIENVFNSLNSSYPEAVLLYGGSINPENINKFFKIRNLGGFLVGGSSLDPNSFISLLKQW